MRSGPATRTEQQSDIHQVQKRCIAIYLPHRTENHLRQLCTALRKDIGAACERKSAFSKTALNQFDSFDLPYLDIFQLASLVTTSLKKKIFEPYASNWLERLRRIKNARAKVITHHFILFAFNALIACIKLNSLLLVQVLKEMSDQVPSASGSSGGGAVNTKNDSEAQWLKADFTKYTN